MKKLIGWILRTYYSIYTPLYFKRKKRKADRLHKLTGRRYHVVPKTRTSLVVVDNSYIDKYNKAVKGKARKITIVDLIKMSWYSTSVEGITRNPQKNNIIKETIVASNRKIKKIKDKKHGN